MFDANDTARYLLARPERFDASGVALPEDGAMAMVGKKRHTKMCRLFWRHEILQEQVRALRLEDTTRECSTPAIAAENAVAGPEGPRPQLMRQACLSPAIIQRVGRMPSLFLLDVVIL